MADWPGLSVTVGWSPTGVKFWEVKFAAMGALSIVVVVRVVVIVEPGVTANTAGLADSVRPCTAGAASVVVVVAVTPGFVVLVTVEVKLIGVPVGGIAPFGTMQTPISPVCPAGMVTEGRLCRDEKPEGRFEMMREKASATRPWFWICARKTRGNWADPNGTVKYGSDDRATCN